MRAPFLYATLLFLSFSVHSQYNFNIKGAFPIRAGSPVIPFEHRMEALAWGSPKSSCVPASGFATGLWLSFIPKNAEASFTLKSGPKFGDISEAIIYLGDVVDHKGQKMLQEVSCAQMAKGSNELTIGSNQLTPKKEYYILVTGASVKKGDRFALEVKDKFVPPVVTVKDEPKSDETYILGRIRSKDNKPKKGVLVSVVNDKMQPVKSVTTDDDGAFRFEKLPLDETTIARIEEDDTYLTVDLFLYTGDGKVKQRATRIGTSLYGFGADQNAFKALKLLTEADWKLNVKEGTNGVAGRIVDQETFLYGQENVIVGLYDQNKSSLGRCTTNVNGEFVFRDLAKGEYSVKMEGKAEGNYSEMVVVDDLNVPFAFANSTMAGPDGFFKFEKLPMEIVELKRQEEKDTRMKLPTDFSAMEEGKAIVLKNILFASGSAELLESSFSELDKLAAEMQKRSAVKIEISGHTDNTGNASTNLLLSENRAKSVKAYLVGKGVASERMVAKGYGHTKPADSNDTEEGKRKNRRVEIVSIK